MSEYVIYNIALSCERPALDFDEREEEGKPIGKNLAYYWGKEIGKKTDELQLIRTRKRGVKERVPNCVIQNKDSVALLRIHNKDQVIVYNIAEDATRECSREELSSYPYAHVVIDYRPDRCQMAIELSSSWSGKTEQIRTILEEFFNRKLQSTLGIRTEIKKKVERTRFESFIERQTSIRRDAIKSFTFEFSNINRPTTVRVPDDMTESIISMSKNLEMFNAIKGTMTYEMGKNVVDNDKLKQLSSVVTYCSDNAFHLNVLFRDYGKYTSDEEIPAKLEMNDIILNYFKDDITPDTPEFDMYVWLDRMFSKIIESYDDRKARTKPRR